MPHSLHQQVKQRLYALSPRAFEFFAGDLLAFLGLDAVVVTRQSGDGGIDAHCEVVSGGGLRVPAGVQVKQWRQPVSRPEMDRFAGALASRYACGIYITTAGFTPKALQKAASIPYITPVNGDQVAEILLAQGVGVHPDARSLDEGYFAMFEAQAAGTPLPRTLVEPPAPYALEPVDDLISLRALSYSLHVDSKTLRSWVQRGLLLPDSASGDLCGDGAQSGLFFRRSRTEEIRRQFRLPALPAAPAEWAARFLAFAMQGQLNMSYKPVLLLALLDHVDTDGAVAEEMLAAAFLAFYRGRAAAGLPAEVPSSILSRPGGGHPRGGPAPDAGLPARPLCDPGLSRTPAGREAGAPAPRGLGRPRLAGCAPAAPGAGGAGEALLRAPGAAGSSRVMAELATSCDGTPAED